MSREDLKANIIEREIRRPNITVVYPEVVGLLPPNLNARHRGVAEKMNQVIDRMVQRMMQEVGVTNPDLAEMIGTFKVTLNKNGILSIRFESFSVIRMAAHPLTIVRALTFNLRTGNVIDLFGLFGVEKGHRRIIGDEIKRQIKTKEIPLISEFTRINDDQEYYLTERALVIFFQRATIAAGAAGILEFPIPYNMLRNIIGRDCVMEPVLWF